jgi:hypothetical protein
MLNKADLQYRSSRNAKLLLCVREPPLCIFLTDNYHPVLKVASVLTGSVKWLHTQDVDIGIWPLLILLFCTA